MKTILFSLFLIFTSSAAFAETETLIITINRSVPAKNIQKAVKALEVVDPTLGQCYFNATVDSYIDYTGLDAPYWGVALVNLNYECAEQAKAKYIKKIQASKKYQLWSNPRIDVNPSVSGG